MHMPRARIVGDEGKEALPKRAPRRTVARAPRKKSIPTINTSVESRDDKYEITRPRRKAPTRILNSASTATGETKSRRNLYVSFGIVTLVIAGAIGFGYSDEGQINPATVISERNARLVAGELELDSIDAGTPTETVIPVQNNPSSIPDGGMVISKSPPPKPTPPPVEVASTTEASSTASSSPEVLSEAELLEETSVDTPAEIEGGENSNGEEVPLVE